MKKLWLLVALVLAFCCVAALLVACGETSEHEEIAAAYAKEQGVDQSTVSFKCYGEFDGTHVVLFDGTYPQALYNEVIGGVIFYHSQMQTFEVYHDGIFCSLNDALYTYRWLSLRDVETVQSNHRAANKALYAEYEQAPKSDAAELEKPIAEEIVDAFVAAHSTDRYPVEKDEVSLRFYGEFDGVYVMFVDVASWCYTDAIKIETVAGVAFVYSCGQTLTVYCDGAFYSLTNAYEQGVISRDKLLAAQKVYVSNHPYLYSEEEA